MVDKAEVVLYNRSKKNDEYHTTTSPEYFQKFYIQKRQGIEIYHTPTVVAS